MADKEKEEKPAKAPATPEEEAKSGKKKKLILFGVIGLLVLGGGGAGAFIFLKGKKSDAPAADGAAEGHGDEPGGAADGDAGHAEGKADGHGEKKEEPKKDDHGGGHGEKKEETKKDDQGGGHGEKKEEPKKDDHGGGGHGEKKEEGGHGEKPAAGKEEEKPKYQGNFGATYTFKPFNLNLGNPLENRYVRVEMAVEYKGGEVGADELKIREPQLRDAVVSIIGRKTREHLLSPDGKDQLRLEIRNKLNQYLDNKVDNVFITDILIE